MTLHDKVKEFINTVWLKLYTWCTFFADTTSKYSVEKKPCPV